MAEQVIRVEVQKTGKGSWLVQWYSEQGRLGTWRFEKRKCAARFAKRLLTTKKMIGVQLNLQAANG